MSLANDVPGAPRVAEQLLAVENNTALSQQPLNVTATDAEAFADQVVALWHGAAQSLIRACLHLVSGLKAFAEDPKKLEIFLRRLITKRVLAENDVLARFKANGKLAMLTKIGHHAETLLEPSLLCLLPAHYSILYQICLLVEEVGPARAEIELSKSSDTTRDDVIKMRAALKPSEVKPDPPSAKVDDSAAQLFALRLTKQDAQLFANEYAKTDMLDQCLRRPQPADHAGLADSDEVAPAYRDDLARDSDMMSPPGPVPLAMGLLALSRLSSTVLLI